MLGRKVLFGAAKNSERGFVANFNKPNPDGADGYAHANDFHHRDGSQGSGIRLKRLTDARSTGTRAPTAEMEVPLEKNGAEDGDLFLLDVIWKNNLVMEGNKVNATGNGGEGFDEDGNFKISDFESGRKDASLNLTNSDGSFITPIQRKVHDNLNQNLSGSIRSDYGDNYKFITKKFSEMNGDQNTEHGTLYEPHYKRKDVGYDYGLMTGTTHPSALDESQSYDATGNVQSFLDSIFHSINSSTNQNNHSSFDNLINLNFNFNFRFKRRVCTTSECKIRNIFTTLGNNKTRNGNDSLSTKEKQYGLTNSSRETPFLKRYASADLKHAPLLYKHPNKLPQENQSLEHDKFDQYIIDSVEMAKMYPNERSYSKKHELIAHGISDNVPVVSDSWKSHQIGALVPDTVIVPAVQLNEVSRKSDSVPRYATPRSLKSELQIFEEDSFDKGSGALKMETEVGDQLKNDIKEANSEQYIYKRFQSPPVLLNEHNTVLNIEETPSMEDNSGGKRSVHYFNPLEMANKENISLSDRQTFESKNKEYSKYSQNKEASDSRIRNESSLNENLITFRNHLTKSDNLDSESESNHLKNERSLLTRRHAQENIFTFPNNGNALPFPDNSVMNSLGLGRKRRGIGTASIKLKNLSESEALQLKAINPELLKAIEFLINQSPPDSKPLTQKDDHSQDIKDGSSDTYTNPIYSKPNTLYPVNSEWKNDYSKSGIAHSGQNTDLENREKSPYFSGAHGEHLPIFRNEPHASKNMKPNIRSPKEWKILGRAADVNSRTIFASYDPKWEENTKGDSPQIFTRPRSGLRNLLTPNGLKEKWSQTIHNVVNNITNTTQRHEIMWYVILPIERTTRKSHYTPNFPIEKSNKWHYYEPISSTEKGTRWPRYQPNLPISKGSNWPHYQPNLPEGKGSSWPHYQPNLPEGKGSTWPRYQPNLPVGKGSSWPHYQPNLPEGKGSWPRYQPNLPLGKGARWPHQPNLPEDKGSWPHYEPNLSEGKGSRWPSYGPPLPPKGKVKPSEREMETDISEDDIGHHVTSTHPISKRPLKVNIMSVMPRLVEFSNESDSSSQNILPVMKLINNSSTNNSRKEQPDDQWVYITTVDKNNKTSTPMIPNETVPTKNPHFKTTTQQPFPKFTTKKQIQTTTLKTIPITTNASMNEVTKKPNTLITVMNPTTKSIITSTIKPNGVITPKKPDISLTTESITSTTTEKLSTIASTKTPENIINKPKTPGFIPNSNSWSMQIPWDCDHWFVPTKWKNKNTTPMMMGMMGGD